MLNTPNVLNNKPLCIASKASLGWENLKKRNKNKIEKHSKKRTYETWMEEFTVNT